MIFDNSYEQRAFKDFVRHNWFRKEEYATNIRIPYMEQVKDYNMDASRKNTGTFKF